MQAFLIHSRLTATLLGILLSGSIAWSQNDSSRTWTSRDGTAQVRATLVQFDRDSGLVRLRDAQGQQRDLSLQQLSLRDQRFLKRQLESAPAADPEELDASQPTRSAQPAPGQKRRLYGIDWQPSLEEGLEVARSLEDGSSSRPVMWFRVLGELDGLM